MDIPAGVLERVQRSITTAALPRNHREEMLDNFLAVLNPPRIEEGFKPLTHKRIATALAGIPTSDLHAFYQQCANAKSFGRMFWWALKPKV